MIRSLKGILLGVALAKHFIVKVGIPRVPVYLIKYTGTLGIPTTYVYSKNFKNLDSNAFVSSSISINKQNPNSTTFCFVFHFPTSRSTFKITLDRNQLLVYSGLSKSMQGWTTYLILSSLLYEVSILRVCMYQSN